MGLGGCALWNGPSAVAPFLSRRNKTKELRPLSPHRGLQGGGWGHPVPWGRAGAPPQPMGMQGFPSTQRFGVDAAGTVLSSLPPHGCGPGGLPEGRGLGNGAGLLGSAAPPPHPKY